MNLVVVSNRHSCEKNSRSGSLGQGGTARAGAGLTFRAGQGAFSCGPGQGWVRTEIKSWDRGPFWQVGVWWDGAPHLVRLGRCAAGGRDAETVRECECVSVRVVPGVTGEGVGGCGTVQSTSRTSHLAIGCDKCNIGERCSGELPVVTGHV